MATVNENSIMGSNLGLAASNSRLTNRRINRALSNAVLTQS